MQRLAIGIVLLAAALGTGVVAGSLDEKRGRSVTHVRTEERVVYRDASVAPAEPEREPEPEPARTDDVASAPAEPEESPETSGVVERMRRHLPGLAEWQADEVRRFHAGYRKKLHAHGMAVAGVLDADPERQRRTVAALRDLRRERHEFLRTLLGPERFRAWREIEINGGRDVDAILQELQGR